MKLIPCLCRITNEFIETDTRLLYGSLSEFLRTKNVFDRAKVPKVVSMLMNQLKRSFPRHFQESNVIEAELRPTVNQDCLGVNTAETKRFLERIQKYSLVR